MAAATVTERVTTLLAQIGGLTILAATLAAVTAAVYRWYVREIVPRGLPLLVGLSGVAVYLNTATTLGQVIAGSTAPTEAERAVFNIAVFLIAGAGTVAGRRAGDQFGTDVVLGSGVTDIDEDVGRLVKSVGRVITVELPDDIDDVTGYDPVPAETKAKLSGRSFLFPRRLTVAELRERLVHRLKTDYAVGHVDVELADDGSVEYLALGSRAAGIGPTLPPATNALALRADPAFAASAGDLVQVWETNPMRRVLTAELRGIAEETVTVAIDAADTPKIDPTAEYRLVTLPVTDRPDREFASLLRAADETFSSVTVAAGSPLHGLPVGSLSVTAVAVAPDEGSPVTLPERSYILSPGDEVFAIARPEALRRLEAAARPLDASLGGRPASAARDESEQPAIETSASDGEDAAVEPSPGSDGTADDAEAGAGSDTESATGSDENEGMPTPEDDSDEEPTLDGSDEAGRQSSDADEDSGGTSFQELKEEFESGDADWADDISDSPGGDMRRDE